jgi:hypothetical protein
MLEKNVERERRKKGATRNLNEWIAGKHKKKRLNCEMEVKEDYNDDNNRSIRYPYSKERRQC